MPRRYHSEDAPFFIGIVIVVLILGGLIFLPAACGVGGCGPSRTVTATVVSKHVDSHKEGSNYMVTTDQGVFEVGNGIFLGVWNSDEIYGQIEVGKEYTFVAMGNKYTNFFCQYYPYIVEVR